MHALRIILLACFIVISLFCYGLTQLSHSAAVDPQASSAHQGSGYSRVLFLEHSLVANGTVVKGEASFRGVNFPSYWFNENTRELHGNISFPLNNSLMMIFGDSLTLKGNWGSGTGNKLFGIYSLPIKANEATILSTDLSGNILINVNNAKIVLRPGKNYTYSQNEKVRDGNAVINVRYEHTYVNHGFIDKTNIIGEMVSS